MFGIFLNKMDTVFDLLPEKWSRRVKCKKVVKIGPIGEDMS